MEKEEKKRSKKKASGRNLTNKRKASAKKLKPIQAPKNHLALPSQGKTSGNTSLQQSKASLSPPNSRPITQVIGPSAANKKKNPQPNSATSGGTPLRQKSSVITNRTAQLRSEMPKVLVEE